MGKIQRLAFLVLTAYLWVMMVLFGAIVLETFMIYPNVFSDPPASLELAMEFMSLRAPNDFFPPIGFLLWVLGACSLVACWPVKAARWWILLSVAMIVCEGVASMLYFWPRNEIMFVEGSGVHSAEYLKQVAQEFETWHWRSRLGFNALAALGAFVGFLRFYRHRLLGIAVGEKT
ncbi:MAG TPA: hypothetical protein VFR69_08100 [Rubrobacteraceae bacterium]|nr:hypothetical protein [Rubrobacteraceae bacterium]